MTPREKELMGEFCFDPTLRRAVELWADYYERTEAFDRLHCAARNPATGNAIPVTREERRLCSRNASERMKILTEAREREGFSDDVWRDAQRIAQEADKR